MSDRHQTKPYPLRISEELRAKLEAQAKTSGRSLNAEIAARLEGSFKPLTMSPEWKDEMGTIFASLITPSLIEMRKVETALKKDLALAGVPADDIQKYISASADPALIQQLIRDKSSRAAGVGAKAPAKRKKP